MFHRIGFLILIELLIFVRFSHPSDAATIRVPQDATTIQSAIEMASAGDVVLVEAGTYRERIRMKPDVTVRSAGGDDKGKLGLQRAEATIIDGGGILANEKTNQLAGVTMASGATLDGFTVTNVGVYDDEAWKTHHATQGENQTHEHIGAPGTAGIEIKGVSCTVKNNIVHHIGYTGIAVQGVADKVCSPLVSRNVCYRNMGGGIGSMRKSTALIEENVCFQNFYAGIGHDDASPTVINNVCYENIRAGIGISEGACPVVRGNKCYRNRRAGIGTRTGAATRPLIENNDCYENDMAGIGTREGASPVIRNNRCYKNKLAGIGSRTGATPTIVGNECYENEQAGIGQQSDAETVLIGNYCHDNRTAGIGYAECKAGKSTVINNRIINNALVAVGIHAGWSVRLTGNEFSREGGLPPMVMVFQGAEATFCDNVIRGSGVAGIRVAGTVRVENNEFVCPAMRPAGPPNFAVWALPGSQVTLRQNKMHGWRHGLHATDATVAAIRNTFDNFHKTALVIQGTRGPADVSGNVATSKRPDAAVLSFDGEAGVIADNRLETTGDDQDR